MSILTDIEAGQAALDDIVLSTSGAAALNRYAARMVADEAKAAELADADQLLKGGKTRPKQPAGAGEPLYALPLKAAIERARKLLQPDPDPAEDTYPLDALGPLSEVAHAIAEGAQVRPAIAGQSVLAVAALSTARTANVRSLDGAVKPLSLYCLTVALSGDGKDSADRPALAAVHAWQREQQEASRQDHWLITSDITSEGLRRALKEGPAAQGVFSTEAGQILAGYAMSEDHRVKTAAALCGLFDCGHYSSVRSGDGRTERYGVRLSAHLLVQPSAMGDTLGDETLAGIGFWPRFLLAWPPPLAPRQYRPWRADQCPAVGHYWRRCRELLEMSAPDNCDTLPIIELDREATAFVAEFFRAMDFESRRGGLRPIRAFGLRSTEMLCRVAGVLTAWAGESEIDVQTARDGCADRAHDDWAATLYEWLAQRREPVAIRDIP